MPTRHAPKISAARHPPALLLVARVATAVGPMLAAATAAGLWRLELARADTLARWRADWPQTIFRAAPLPATMAAALGNWPRGALPPLVLCGTDFQCQVWRGLLQLRAGETISYGALAAQIGRPRAARAVGQAVGANRLAPLVPCHRVLAADGLGGYSGRGGLATKRQLLAAEAKISAA